MRYDEGAINNLVVRLTPLGHIEYKRMFGGIGFFHDGKMFAMIGDDTFRLKTSDYNRKDFEDRGMGPFVSGKKGRSMPYYELPEDVLENDSELLVWVQKSIDLAHKKV